MLDEHHTPRRRKLAQETQDRKVVREALWHLVRRVDTLQREGALLNARLMREPGREELRPRIVALQTAVVAVAADLDAAVSRLLPAQRGHGRIVDLRRCIDQLKNTVLRLG